MTRLSAEREAEIRNRNKEPSLLFNSHDAHIALVEDIPDLLAEIDALRGEIANMRLDMEWPVVKERDQLSAKFDMAGPLLEERYLLLKFLQSRDLLFDAHEFLAKMKGKK